MRTVAEKIDSLVENNAAFVAEGDLDVNISKLSVDGARVLWPLCLATGLGAKIFDSVGSEYDASDGFLEGFAPYRIVLAKPLPIDGELRILTNSGFAKYLQIGNSALVWRIARLDSAIVTAGRAFLSWDANREFSPREKTKSPRALVKDYGLSGVVPSDIRVWLAENLEPQAFTQPAVRIWIKAAYKALVLSIPDEISIDDQSLKFKGPPRISYPPLNLENFEISFKGFSDLTTVVSWVFENERESEMRHILLAAEIARSAATADGFHAFVESHLRHALESAQIAYQMAISETGKDTLKALVDLRKAITDETSKLSDLSRQLTGSVATALATGLGLIAAKFATSAPGLLIISLMVVADAYVLMTIISGWRFMALQRALREHWYDRLYRFLPKAEYDKLVTTPTETAERSFKCTAFVGGVATLLLSICCVVLTPSQKDAPDRDKPNGAPDLSNLNITGSGEAATGPPGPVAKPPVIQPTNPAPSTRPVPKAGATAN